MIQIQNFNLVSSDSDAICGPRVRIVEPVLKTCTEMLRQACRISLMILRSEYFGQVPLCMSDPRYIVVYTLQRSDELSKTDHIQPAFGWAAVSVQSRRNIKFWWAPKTFTIRNNLQFDWRRRGLVRSAGCSRKEKVSRS